MLSSDLSISEAAFSLPERLSRFGVNLKEFGVGQIFFGFLATRDVW